MKLNVKIKRLNDAAIIPKYAHEHDAGFDLVAADDIVIEPGQAKLIPTGLSFAIPPGYNLEIRPRSGITLRTKLRVQIGTCDSGYIGEVGVIVDNIAERSHRTGHVIKTIDGNTEHIEGLTRYLDENTYIVHKGDRIGQGVIAPVESVKFVDADVLDESIRSIHGFGSSGVK